jgi:hypothetical protein
MITYAVKKIVSRRNQFVHSPETVNVGLQSFQIEAPHWHIPSPPVSNSATPRFKSHITHRPIELEFFVFIHTTFPMNIPQSHELLTPNVTNLQAVDITSAGNIAFTKSAPSKQRRVA